MIKLQTSCTGHHPTIDKDVKKDRFRIVISVMIIEITMKGGLLWLIFHCLWVEHLN